MKTFVSRRMGVLVGSSAIALALGLACPAEAQTTSGIRGHIDGAAAGSTVIATDSNTGQRLTATVDAQGNYQFLGLRPSTYHVASGAKSQDVTVPLAQTVSVDFLSESAGNNAIIVTGRRRAEVRTATVQTNVSQQQIENLPQNDRNFLNFAALAPGVSVTPSGQDKRIQAGAVSADQTNVFIDGLSLKNPVNHGGIAGQNFSPGNPFPQLAVQEFAVDTQNFKAEYEQAGSAIITAVTKTGGRKLHGDAFGETQPKSFIGRPYFDRPGKENNRDGSREKPEYRRYQYGADIGGPIIPGLLHFFVAMEGTDTKLPSTTVNVDSNRVPAAIATALNGNVPQTFKQKLYFGKLSLFATSNDTIDASAFMRKERNLRDFGGSTAPSHGHDITSDGRLYQLEWRHRAENFNNDAIVAYNTFSNGTPRVSSGPEIVLLCQQANDADKGCNGTPTINSGGVANLGASNFVQNDRQKTYTFKDVVTFNRGAHIIKAGVKLTDNTYERLEDLQSNGSYYFNSATYTGFDSSTPIAARVSTLPVLPATAKNKQIGLFIQDDWSPDTHLTVNAGIRWDYETNAKNEKFVTPANIVDALRAYQPWKAAGINPEDYISTGSNRHPYKYAFQPRVGVSYDVNGDRDLIFFGGAGRYYDRPLFIEAGIETLKAYYQSVSTVEGGVIPKNVDALRALAISQGLRGDVWLLNNKTKLPYSDQFNLGVRKRFGSFNTAATVSYVRSHNLFQFVRGNRLPNGGYPTVAATGEFAIVDNFPRCPDVPPYCVNGVDGQLPGFNGKLNIGANKGSANYLALFLTADKPYTKASRWGMTAALTLQKARTNDGTDLGADEFFAGPSQNQFGTEYVPGISTFTFVGTGIVGLPYDILLSGTVNLTSGPAFGRVDFYPDRFGAVYNAGGVYFPRKLITYKNLDLRVAKTFKLPWGHSLTADFQVYNVFDSVNRSYSTWGAGCCNSDRRLKEDNTIGNARSYQAGLKYSF